VYTQCSKCETVFKLSAEVLRAAGGQVRCGKCGEVFSALARLTEDASAFAAGESPLELETRADRILESVVVLQVAQTVAKDYEEYVPPGVEIAQLEVLDWSEDDQAEDPTDRSMEFTLPPGELDRIFVESKMPAPQSDSQAESPLESQPESSPESQPESPLESPAEPQIESQSDPEAKSQIESPAESQAESQTESLTESQAESLAAPQAASQALVFDAAPPPAPEPLSPHPESVSAHAAAPLPPPSNLDSGFDVPDDVRRDMLAGFEQHVGRASRVHDSPRRSLQQRSIILWLSAAIVAALLLAAQIVHQNRPWLVAHAQGSFGAGIRALYGVLGSPLPQPANLSAYQLRQWGVTGDPDANGTLRLRASILNAAAQLQPYPLLRVTLADRFGKSIGRRDFEPTEYLGKQTAKLLAPGERVDATLEILDPGKNAEGFEIDVCLRGVDQRVACQSDAAPQTKQ
jgi:predicted Zn finger-like uncharacterized protein